MKIDYAGRVYHLDLDDISNKQAVKILEFTGKGALSEWLKACAEESDPAFIRSVDALYWLMIRQDGDSQTPLADVDYMLARFMDAFKNALEAEAKAQGKESEPDPTRPAEGSAPSPGPSSRSKTAAGAEGSPDG